MLFLVIAVYDKTNLKILRIDASHKVCICKIVVLRMCLVGHFCNNLNPTKETLYSFCSRLCQTSLHRSSPICLHLRLLLVSRAGYFVRWLKVFELANVEGDDRSKMERKTQSEVGRLLLQERNSKMCRASKVGSHLNPTQTDRNTHGLGKCTFIHLCKTTRLFPKEHF